MHKKSHSDKHWMKMTKIECNEAFPKNPTYNITKWQTLNATMLFKRMQHTMSQNDKHWMQSSFSKDCIRYHKVIGGFFWSLWPSLIYLFWIIVWVFVTNIRDLGSSPGIVVDIRPWAALPLPGFESFWMLDMSTLQWIPYSGEGVGDTSPVFLPSLCFHLIAVCITSLFNESSHHHHHDHVILYVLMVSCFSDVPECF